MKQLPVDEFEISVKDKMLNIMKRIVKGIVLFLVLLIVMCGCENSTKTQELSKNIDLPLVELLRDEENAEQSVTLHFLMSASRSTIGTSQRNSSGMFLSFRILMEIILW